MDIGIKIKTARILKNLTQKELADKIGVTWEMISRYETGKVNPFNKIFAISKILNIPMSYLMGDKIGYSLNESYDIVEYDKSSEMVAPLITNIQDLFNDEIISSTKLSYVIPSWIKSIVKGRVYVITTDDIVCPNEHIIEGKGIIIIEVTKVLKDEDVILMISKTSRKYYAYVDYKRDSFRYPNIKIIGRIIVFEKKIYLISDFSISNKVLFTSKRLFSRSF